jgi:hypothetical protein
MRFILDDIGDYNMEEIMKTEEDLYTDQQTTFLETFAVVKGKIAAGIPMSTAKEELMEDFIRDWSELFSWETAK